MEVTHGTVAGTNNPAFPISKDVWEDAHVITGAPLSVDITVTTAELLALASSEKVLVAAAGSGKLIRPTSITARFIYGSAGFTTDDSDPTIGYAGGWNPFNGSIYLTGQFDDAITFFELVTTAPQPPSEILNKALVLGAVGTLSGGAGGSLKIHVEYTIIDWS